MSDDSKRTAQQGTELLVTGAGVGALGVAGALLGVVCPLCTVATPALIGLGLVQKYRAHRMRERAAEAAAQAQAAEAAAPDGSRG